MMFSIELTKKALDTLKKFPQKDQKRVLLKIYELRENPKSQLRKLRASTLWRLRIGKYRAIIDVIVKGKRIIVLRIGKRENIY